MNQPQQQNTRQQPMPPGLKDTTDTINHNSCMTKHLQYLSPCIYLKLTEINRILQYSHMALLCGINLHLVLQCNQIGICFVWFDSLRPINNLSVKQGRVFLGWTSTKLR